MKRTTYKTGIWALLSLFFIMLAGLASGVSYYTVNYGDTVTLCDGCSIVSDNEYYFMYIDQVGQVTITKRLGENSYSDLKVIDIDNVKNIKYGDMWVESGTIHACIVENSTGNDRIYYAGYGTGVSDGQVKLTGGECSIVEGADNYPHIFNGVNEYRWDGGAWVEDSDVFSTSFDKVTDVVINGSNYIALGVHSDGSEYRYGILDSRSGDSGDFSNQITASTDVGGIAGILKWYNVDGSSSKELIAMGGSCVSAGYFTIGIYNGSNWRNTTQLKWIDGSHCNSGIIDASLTKLGDIFYAYYTATDSDNDLLVSEGNFNSWSESTAIATLNGEMYFSADSDSDEEYLLYDDNSSTSIVRIRYDLPTYDYSGYVYDLNGDPITGLPLVSFEKDGSTNSDLCDASGYFELNNLEEGDYDYNISVTGYTDLTGSMSIDSDSSGNYYYMSSTSTNTSNSHLTLKLFNDDNSVYPDLTATLEYVDGCGSLIGNKYYMTTDDNGSATKFLPNGEYMISKTGYWIKYPYDTYYSEYEYFSMFSDTYKSFYLKDSEGTSNISVNVLDSYTNDEIANATVILQSEDSSSSEVTNASGIAEFSVINDDYTVIIQHPDYYDFPYALQDYDVIDNIIEEGELDNEDFYFFLQSVTEEASTISGCVYDRDTGKDINATVHFKALYRWDTRENVHCYNFTNITIGVDVDEGDQITIKATNDDYFNYAYEMVVGFGMDYEHDIYMRNATGDICGVFILDNNISDVWVRVEAEEWDDSKFAYLNNSHEAEFCTLLRNTIYTVTSELGTKYNYLYSTHYGDVQVNNTDFEYHYTIKKERPESPFYGYVKDTNGNGIENVEIKLISGSDEYTFFTHTLGRFWNDVYADTEYYANISKEGYAPSPLVIHNITLPLPEGGVTYELYSEEGLIPFYVDVVDNQSADVGGASVVLENEEYKWYGKTDTYGRAVIDLVTGEYSLKVQKEGYQTYISDEDLVISGTDTEKVVLKIKKEPSHEPFGMSDFFGFVDEMGWMFMLLVFVLFMVLTIVTLYRNIASG